jgi:hypothetical protein
LKTHKNNKRTHALTLVADKVIPKPYAETIEQLGDNCIVFENFTASIGDLMVAN